MNFTIASGSRCTGGATSKRDAAGSGMTFRAHAALQTRLQNKTQCNTSEVPAAPQSTTSGTILRQKVRTDSYRYTEVVCRCLKQLYIQSYLYMEVGSHVHRLLLTPDQLSIGVAVDLTAHQVEGEGSKLLKTYDGNLVLLALALTFSMKLIEHLMIYMGGVTTSKQEIEVGSSLHNDGISLMMSVWGQANVQRAIVALTP